ncbi:MAG: MBL fold metallo-hydrolase [Dehalococcoidia bacterium]|nr:MBL fold metallo-hydrolase [Dehalococcoidia bacterium]
MDRSSSLEVSHDVYLVGGVDLSHPYDCLVYLVDGGQEMVLIDSGAGEGYELIVDNIRSLGLQPERITGVVATHAHIDHIGALWQFQQELGSKVMAHELDAKAIETGVGSGAEYYGVGYRTCEVDVVLKGSGGTLQCGRHSLRWIHIPGHTPGSIAVYLDIAGRRVLFGQDIHGPYFLKGSNKDQARASLQRLIELEADVLCEGHFGVYEPKEEVRRYIDGYRRGLQ